MESRTEAERLATIRGLLDKAERTTFPEEAKTFAAKAQELMVKWAVDDAMLKGVVDDGTIGITNIWVPANEFRGPKTDLINTVAFNNNCRAVRYQPEYQCQTCNQKMYGTSVKNAQHPSVAWDVAMADYKNLQPCDSPTPRRMLKMAVAGFDRDRRFVEVLYTSLLIQAEREFESPVVHERMRAESPGGNHAGGAHIRWRNAFMLGYQQGVSARLWAAKKAAQDAADAHRVQGQPGSAIVLADRARMVDSKMGDLFGKLTKGKGHGAGNSWGSGSALGAAAASRADLGRPQAGSGNRGALGS